MAEINGKINAGIFPRLAVFRKNHTLRTLALSLFKLRLKKYLKKRSQEFFFALILCPGIIFFKNFFFVLPPYHQSFVEIKSNTRGRKDKKLFFCMHFFLFFSVHITLFLLLEFLTVEISGMELTFF